MDNVQNLGSTETDARKKQLSASMQRIAQHIQELRAKYGALEVEYSRAHGKAKRASNAAIPKKR
jgi:hypothetical protein